MTKHRYLRLVRGWSSTQRDSQILADYIRSRRLLDGRHEPQVVSSVEQAVSPRLRDGGDPRVADVNTSNTLARFDVAAARQRADLDSRAGAPVGSALRAACDEIERLRQELAFQSKRASELLDALEEVTIFGRLRHDYACSFHPESLRV